MAAAFLSIIQHKNTWKDLSLSIIINRALPPNTTHGPIGRSALFCFRICDPFWAFGPAEPCSVFLSFQETDRPFVEDTCSFHKSFPLMLYKWFKRIYVRVLLI